MSERQEEVIRVLMMMIMKKNLRCPNIVLRKIEAD
jgi:hypothetical protein